FFFFFQAEDGIRDDLVTGVQTCALPIYDLSGFTGNGKHHPVAELGVHVYRRTLLGVPTLVIPTEGRNLLFYPSIVTPGEFRRFVCGVAGRVEGFAVYLTADG